MITIEGAKELLIEGINYAAYKETDSSLSDSDKNRLYGEEHYYSGRMIAGESPWSDGDFEGKMAELLTWATRLNASKPEFAEARKLLGSQSSVIGRVIRRADGPVNISAAGIASGALTVLVWVLSLHPLGLLRDVFGDTPWWAFAMLLLAFVLGIFAATQRRIWWWIVATVGLSGFLLLAANN
ncbi:hypothetical protein Acid345_4421 [Candidatus Koribacter versatilis Ellin345]|uniref:Uncharacterized protein n=1 Tax=Koribacter versatilis (strain Ellin345) TaxID=204669 RepID=Q1II79_KORVE|nr:hypothetical protein Acid345_4421 [Candidatus Koribacter versatilis Ellin345]